MQFRWQTRRTEIVRLLVGGAIAVAFAACGGNKPMPETVKRQVDDNCQANVETSQADLKFCAKDKPESCADVSKDLAQITKLKPKNKDIADEVSKHVSGCQGKGEADAECTAAASAIAKLDCTQ